MVMVGFEMVPLGLHGFAGQATHPADQQPSGFPLGMGINGNDSIRIAMGKSVCDPIQLEHLPTPVSRMVVWKA
jgi:hypothetical protein